MIKLGFDPLDIRFKWFIKNALTVTLIENNIIEFVSSICIKSIPWFSNGGAEKWINFAQITIHNFFFLRENHYLKPKKEKKKRKKRSSYQIK